MYSNICCNCLFRLCKCYFFKPRKRIKLLLLAVIIGPISFCDITDQQRWQRMTPCSVPGFDSLLWQDSRNQVLQRRNEEPILDLTVRVLLCLDTKAQTRISENTNMVVIARSEQRTGKLPCLCKLDSPQAPETRTSLCLQ